MYAYKDLLELAGLTTRLYTLLSTLHNLPPLPVPSDSPSVEMSHVDVKVPTTANGDDEDQGYVPISNELVLVKDLSFKLEVGEHLMITGSNGVGKTSVARVLAGLWPAQEGEVRRSAGGNGRMGVFIVPQRVYMVQGTLLDQMIYPHSYIEFKESGKTEADLMEILTAAHLAYLPAREGGWSARKEWRDVLSGGEKQRVRHLSGILFLLSFSNVSHPRWAWPACFTIFPGSQSLMVRRRYSTSFILYISRMSRMHKCCVKRRRGEYVRARKIFGDHFDHNFTSVSPWPNSGHH